MPVELNSRIVRYKDKMSAPIDNDIVIVNMAKNNYTGLNEIGRIIWELLAKPCRVDELCNRLSLDFAATPDKIAADVLPFLEELRQDELIMIVS